MSPERNVLPGGYGATAACLTPDQKVGSSNLSGLTSYANLAPNSQELGSKTPDPDHPREKNQGQHKNKIPPGKEDFQVMKT